MSEETQNTMCFALVANFMADRHEFAEWLNTYGHADNYDLEVTMKTQDRLVHVTMLIPPVSITLKDLTITQKGEDTFSSNPLDHFVEKIEALTDFDGKVDYIISSVERVDFFWEEVKLGANADLAKKEETLIKEELWEVLDISVTKMKFGAQQKRAQNCLRDDNVVYIGELVQRTEAEVLRIANFGRKCFNEAKADLKSRGLAFGMDYEELLGWTRAGAEERKATK